MATIRLTLVALMLLVELSPSGDAEEAAPGRPTSQPASEVAAIVKIFVDTGAGETIEQAQRAVLAELTGTSYRILRLYVRSPFMALAVGTDALAVLQRSTKVLSVTPDFELRPKSQ